MIFKAITVKLKPKHQSNFLNDDLYLQIAGEAYSFKKKHRLNNTDILNLLGGVPHQSIVKVKMTYTELSEDELKVLVFYKNKKNKKIAKVCQTIDYKDMILDYQEMLIFETNQGISINLFINEVNWGQKLGFRRIDVTAAGGIDFNKTQPDAIFQGYYHWSRCGLVLFKEDQENIKEWLHEHSRAEKTLKELVASDEGYELWKKEGISWDGYFDLQKGSESIKTFKSYLIDKEINASVDGNFDR